MGFIGMDTSALMGLVCPTNSQQSDVSEESRHTPVCPTSLPDSWHHFLYNELQQDTENPVGKQATGIYSETFPNQKNPAVYVFKKCLISASGFLPSQIFSLFGP